MKRRSFIRMGIALLVCLVQLTALRAQDRMEIKAPALTYNSIVYNHRPGNKDLDMPYLLIDYINAPSTSVLIFNNGYVIPNGQSSPFTMPALTGVYRITLRHADPDDIFYCEEYATMVINGVTYTGMSTCLEGIQWDIDPSLNITGGVTIDVH